MRRLWHFVKPLMEIWTLFSNDCQGYFIVFLVMSKLLAKSDKRYEIGQCLPIYAIWIVVYNIIYFQHLKFEVKGAFTHLAWPWNGPILFLYQQHCQMVLIILCKFHSDEVRSLYVKVGKVCLQEKSCVYKELKYLVIQSIPKITV